MRMPIVTAIVVCSLAGTALPAKAEPPGPTPVYRHVDRGTGAEVRLYRPAATRASVEVVATDLQIVKSLAPGRTETRIVGSGEDLTITLDRAGLAVTDGRLEVTADGATVEGLRQARSRIQASTAVRRAVHLLERMDVRDTSPISHTLLVTRALLESALGEPDADDALRSWSKRAGSSVRLLRASAQQNPDSPTDCWTNYVMEAITAWIEYEDCVDSEEWWDIPGMLSCLLIYDVRAIGAFSWWVSCVGFRG